MSSTRSSKKRHNDIIDQQEEVDVSADRLNTKFWSTVSVFINNGVTLEDKTMRWQHALKNLYYIIGRNQKEEHGTFDGGIAPETQKLVELDEEDPAPTRTRNRRGEPLTPPPTSESASKAAFRTSPRSTASTWPMFWQRMAITYKESKWVAGVSNVLTHMITHNGVDDVVKLANKLYETRDIVALNNATKTKTQLSNGELCTLEVHILLANRNLGQGLRDLERQLDQIDDDSGQQQLDSTFLAQYYLEVLGYGKSSKFPADEVKTKTRLVKAQRMTANNIKALIDGFGEGFLILLCGSTWASALDQVSYKTLKPLLERLAGKELELHKVAEMAKKILKYAANKGLVTKMLKIVIRAQELTTRQRRKLSLTKSLGPSEADLERAYRDYIFAVIIFYENTAEVTRQITQQYHDFHKKVDCEMEGKLVWTEKGREAPVDRQASVAMLLDMLRENVAGVLKGFRLEESDEDALISLMKRHGAKVKEITQLRAATGIKSNAVELPAETTTTAKLAGGVLHRRFFE
ncbi:hypothetical protein D6D28_04106 [Aureobasidium pullulans]|uniref:Uncharacterized protein n=1 Tax=Aureobasidium pullulans TaxID=5580 RepID=A0A4S8SM28_AURPU|nr:hypothetical protein D6D28_04106 [Aureobasidium pullulans]